MTDEDRSPTARADERGPRVRLGTPELVALVACSMSLVALAIDAMLPALGAIADDLGARGDNDRQLVLTAFFVGITGGQIVHGTLADALGRRRAMVGGLALFGAGTLLCLLATSFPTLLAGRFIEGLGAAGPRIVALAIVRDLYEGRAMARIMSFVTAVFILVPIVAPSIGQGLLLVASWPWIFGVLGLMSAVVLVWFVLRQPETLPAAKRRPLAVGPIVGAIGDVLRSRETVRYTLAAGLVFAALIAYLATAQQIFGELYGLGAAFPLCFAALAAALGAASIVNGRLVMRFGMRALSGVALRVSTVTSAAFLGVALATAGRPPFWAFFGYMAVVFFCNGLLFGNFNALAMEPLGHIAGSGAAVVGTLTSLVSTVVGTPIGRLYDGTVIPLVGGLFAMTLLALGVTQAGSWKGPSTSKVIPTPSATPR
jgi:DHA1 family bicyclomycin/chloramphenicol resistance-like MFS transporter